MAYGLTRVGNRRVVRRPYFFEIFIVANFAAIVWIPGAIVHPTDWLRWAGVGITLAMMGGVWSLGDYLSWISAGEIRNPAENDWRARTARVG
jgi:hypothetical protein